MALDKSRIYTPKEALHDDPDWTIPVTLGRGRMPKGGDAHCRALVEKGYKIKGYSVSSTPAKSTSKASKPAVVKRGKPTNEKVIADYVIFWDDQAYKAVSDNKQVYGMAEVCNNCRVSLVQCHCGGPTILGDIAVRIVPVGRA